MTTTATDQPMLQLTDGAVFLGEYKNSGLKEAPYIIRRGDGDLLYVSRLLYLVALAIDRCSHPDEAAAFVSHSYDREVSAENVLYLAEHKLTPLGLIVSDHPAAVAPITANPLLALRLRLPLVPERAHRVLSTALTPLFWPPFIIAALVGLVMADVWLFTSQTADIYEGMQKMVFEPRLLLTITLLTLMAGAFHEFGHAAAARYGGATPGAMGAGVYIVWPVFYTDVSDTYRLDRRARLRTDLGGLYFNVLFILGSVAAYGYTGYSPLLVLAALVQVESLRQFLPFIRLDGYYVMSDLAGVPNLFSYMGPVLTVLIRRRDPEARAQARRKVDELTRRARLLITGWVLITAPVIAFNVVLFAILLPQLAGLAWGSAGYQIETMTTATGAISPVGIANGLINLTLLSLPVAGMGYLLGMILRRGAHFAVRSWPQRPALTAAVSTAVAMALLGQIGVVWPNSFAGAREQAQLNAGEDETDRFELALSDLTPGQLPLTPVAVPGEAPRPDEDNRDGKDGANTTVAAPPLSDLDSDSDPDSMTPTSPDAPSSGSPTSGAEQRTSGSRSGPLRSAPTGHSSVAPPTTSGTQSPSTTEPAPGDEPQDPDNSSPDEEEDDEDSGLDRVTEALFGFLRH